MIILSKDFIEKEEVDIGMNEYEKLDRQFDVFRYSDRIKFATDYNEGATPSNNLYLYHEDILYEIYKRLNLPYPHMVDDSDDSDDSDSDSDSDDLNQECSDSKSERPKYEVSRSAMPPRSASPSKRLSYENWDLCNYVCRYNNYVDPVTHDDVMNAIHDSSLFNKDIIDKFDLAFRGIDWDWNLNGDHHIHGRGVFCNDIRYYIDGEAGGLDKFIYNRIKYPGKDIWKFIPYVYFESRHQQENEGLENLIVLHEFNDWYMRLMELTVLNEIEYFGASLKLTRRYRGTVKTSVITLSWNSKFKFVRSRLLQLCQKQFGSDVGLILKKKNERCDFSPECIYLREFTSVKLPVLMDIICKNKWDNNFAVYQQLKNDFNLKFADEYPEGSFEYNLTKKLKEMLRYCIFVNESNEELFDEDKVCQYFEMIEFLDFSDPQKIKEVVNKLKRKMIILHNFDVDEFINGSQEVMKGDEYARKLEVIKTALNSLGEYEAITYIADYLGINIEDYKFNIGATKNRLREIERMREPSDEFYAVFTKDKNVKPKQYYDSVSNDYLMLKTTREIKIGNIDYTFDKNEMRIDSEFNEYVESGNFTKDRKYVFAPQLRLLKGSVMTITDDDKYYYPYGHSEFKGNRKNKYLTNIVFESSMLMKGFKEEYGDEIYDFKPYLTDNELNILSKIETPEDYAMFIYQSVTRLKLQVPFDFNPFIYLQCQEALDLIEYISGYRVFKSNLTKNDHKTEILDEIDLNKI